MLDLRTKLEDFRAKRRENKYDKGAGFVEYGAIILLVAAIAGAVFGFGLDDKVVNLLNSGYKNIVDEAPVEVQEGEPEAEPSDPPEE